MSVTTIIDDKQTRAFLKDYIRPPKMPERPAPLVPSRSAPGRMGTAIDYAIRFGLEVRGGYAPQWHIVADTGLRIAMYEERFAPMRETAVDRYLRATYDLGDLHATEALPHSVAEACLRLVALDLIRRTGRPDDLDWEPDDVAVAELRALYALTPWDQLRPESWGVLNPGFEEGSSLVGGADADIALDGCLVEIKTTKKTAPDIKHIRQLVAYALLANRYGISDAPASARIDTLAIYFTRPGYLFRFPLDACIDPAHHDTVLDFLLGVAARQGGAGAL